MLSVQEMVYCCVLYFAEHHDEQVTLLLLTLCLIGVTLLQRLRIRIRRLLRFDICNNSVIYIQLRLFYWTKNKHSAYISYQELQYTYFGSLITTCMRRAICSSVYFLPPPKDGPRTAYRGKRIFIYSSSSYSKRR